MIFHEIYKYKACDEKIIVKGTFDELDFNKETKALIERFFLIYNDSNEKNDIIFGNWYSVLIHQISKSLEESSLNYVISEIRVNDV